MAFNETLRRFEGFPLIGGALRSWRIGRREEELAHDLLFEQWYVKNEIDYDSMLRKLWGIARDEGLDVDEIWAKASRYWNPTGSL